MSHRDKRNRKNETNHEFVKSRQTQKKNNQSKSRNYSRSRGRSRKRSPEYRSRHNSRRDKYYYNDYDYKSYNRTWRRAQTPPRNQRNSSHSRRDDNYLNTSNCELIPQYAEHLAQNCAQNKTNESEEPNESIPNQTSFPVSAPPTNKEGVEIIDHNINLEAVTAIFQSLLEKNSESLGNYEHTNNLEALIANTIVKNIYGNGKNLIEEKSISQTDEEISTKSACTDEANSDESNAFENTKCKKEIDYVEHEIESESDGSYSNLHIKCEKTMPSISLVPLSFLTEPRLDDTVICNADDNLRRREDVSDSTDPNSSTILGDVFKKPELISKKLINQVATMDKTNIRHVINNPISKFDVALKMHAKKRLREEIRKQLRNMNFETAKIADENILEPDDYIDTENIPSEMLDKFKTVFGFNFAAHMSTEENNDRLQSSEDKAIPDRRKDTVRSEDYQPGSTLIHESTPPPRIDLRTRLKNLEEIKQQASLKKSKQLEDDDVYIIENPKEDATILHDDSSSDSNTTNTSASPIPHIKLQEKFLESFKKIILPNMPDKERQEYEKKMHKGEELVNIYNMCLDKLNDQKGNSQPAKLYDFNGSNSEEALHFLVKNIHNLFSKEKSENKQTSSELAEKIPKSSCEINSNSGDAKSTSSINETKGKWKPRNRRTKERRERKAAKYQTNRSERDSSSKLSSKDKESEQSQNELQKQRSSDDNRQDRPKTEQSNPRINAKTNHTVNKNEKYSSESNSDKVRCEVKDQLNSLIYIDLDTPPKPSQNNRSSDDVRNNNSSNERLWRSPGEKKCLQLTPEITPPRPEIHTPSHINESPSPNSNVKESTPETHLPTNYLELKNNIGDNYINPSEIFQITSLVEQNKISSNVLNNLKDIDSKLMDLNKKKMYIERNIIQLQKEKMEIDLSTMQLQSDRFELISSALSNPSTYLTPNPTIQKCPNFTESTINEFYTINNFSGKIANNCTADTVGGKRKRYVSPIKKTTNFSEKLKNRKKRCQRDILIEHAAITLFSEGDKRCEEIRTAKPSELSEKVDNIFTMPARRNQKPRQEVISEKSRNLRSNLPRTIKDPVDKLLPVSCLGNTVNIIDCDISDDSAEEIVKPTPTKNISNGILKGFRLPIVQIVAIEGYVICASEDGNIYKFDLSTRQLISTFAKHTESITGICIDGNSSVYSTSLDGYMKKTTIENFGLELQSVNLHEPLQAINLSWNVAFIGSRWGNIFTYDTKTNKLNETLLCSVGSAITALKATKEGPRKILIIASKGEKIHFRDAASGLLLRTIDVPDNQNIYSIILNGGLLYCGSSTNHVYTYDFTTGNQINNFICGNGAVSIKLFKNRFIFVGCYDGFIYVLEKYSGEQIGRFPGAGKMLLALEIIGEKLLTASKDNLMEIIDIPKYILALIK